MEIACVANMVENSIEIVHSDSEDESGRASTSTSMAATAGLLLRLSIHVQVPCSGTFQMPPTMVHKRNCVLYYE